MRHTYLYPRPEVAVDCVVFGANLTLESGQEDRMLQVLLVQRADEGRPFDGKWALPGRIVRIHESLDVAAETALDKAGVHDVYLEQLYTFGAPGRDPDGRVISVAYYALVRPDRFELRAGQGSSEARWVTVQEALGMDLAFDHADILRTALKRLRGKVTYEPIGFELMPQTFTMPELQRLYEAVLGRTLDKRNFQSKMQKMGVLKEMGMREPEGRGRPPREYAFDTRRYRRLVQEGFSFEV